MSVLTSERWFPDPQLDLSFSFKDAPEPVPFFSGSLMTSTRNSPGTKDQQYWEGQGGRPRVDDNYHQAAGTSLPINKTPILPILEFDAMNINPIPQSDTLLAVSEFEATSCHPPSAYVPYTAQKPRKTKPTPTHSTLAMPVSRMPSDLIEASMMPTDTTPDYSLLIITPPQNSKYSTPQHWSPRDKQGFKPQDNLGNPQTRSKQFIQQSAQRPNNRIISPQGASFILVQKSHRSNSRGPTRQTSTKNLQHSSSGKLKTMGNSRNMHVSLVGAQRIQVIRRPSRKPVIVRIPAKRMRASNIQRLPTEGSATPAQQKIILSRIIDLPPQNISNSHSAIDSPEEFPVPEPPTIPSKDFPGNFNTTRPGIRPIPRPATIVPPRKSCSPEPRLRAASAPPSVVESRLAKKPLSRDGGKGSKTAGKEDITEVPEILRIGNKKNSSLTKRLVNLESLDVRSRY